MAAIDEKKAFGRAIKALRAEKGLSQEALADLAGVQRPTLSAIERGTSDPRLSTLFRLAEAMGEPPNVLIARTEAVITSSKKG